MQTSTFLAELRTHAGLPLVFQRGDQTVSPSYHLTEVKRVSYETMDCGAITHRWAESQFEVWAPATPEAGRTHMAAGKFLQIVDRVQADLPLADEVTARVLVAFGGEPAALHDIGAVRAADGKLQVDLVPDRARCKAAERRIATQTGSCCGVGAQPNEAARAVEATAAADAAEVETAEIGCACAPVGAGRAVAACCA